MRCFIAALLLLGAVILPKQVEALECPLISLSYQPAEGVEAPAEKQRRDAEARTALGRLERTPIIFRGRIASRRYLSDPSKAGFSLLVFDHVEILRGRLPRNDRKAFIIKEHWCDHRCDVRMAALAWPHGETVVFGAHPDPSKVVDSFRRRVVYKGRIDAVLELCNSGGPLAPMELELLSAPREEIARLKREYVPQRPY